MTSNQRFPRKPPYPPLPTQIFLDDPPVLSPAAAASAARITAHAERYLRGEQLYIHSARLRGPFIINPWAEKPPAKACVAAKSTRSKTAKSVVIAETPSRGTQTTAVHHSIGTPHRVQAEASEQEDGDSHIEFSLHLTARRRSSRATSTTTTTPAHPASPVKRTKRKRVPLRLASPDRHHNIPLSVYSPSAASEPKPVASAPAVAKEKEKENECRRKRVRVDFDALSPAIVGERRHGVKGKLLEGKTLEPISPPRIMAEKTLDPISPPRTVAEDGGTITLSQRSPDDVMMQTPKQLEPPAHLPEQTESQLKATEGIRESVVVSFLAEHADDPAPEPTTTPLPPPKTPHQSTQSALLSAQRKFFEAMADSPLDTPAHGTEDSFLLPALPAPSARDTPVLPTGKLGSANIGAGVYSDSFLGSSDDDYDDELRDVRSDRKVPTYTQFTPFTKPRWSNASPSPPKQEESELRQAHQKTKPRWSDPSPSPSPRRDRDGEQEQSFGPPLYASTGIDAPANGTPAQSTPAPSARIEVTTTPLPPPRVDVAETPAPPAPFPAEVVPITPAAFPGTSSTIIDSVIETPPLPSHPSTHGRPQPSASTLSRFEQPDTSTSSSHLNSTHPDPQNTFAAANETSTFPDAQNPNTTPYEPTPFYRFSSPPAEESGSEANELVKEVAGFMKDDWDDGGLGGYGGGEEGDSTVSILSTPGGGWGASAGAQRSQRSGKVGVRRGLWG